MTVEAIAKALDCDIAAGGAALRKAVAGGYCGDLLSWVMGRAQAGSVWITVMGNVNAVAVAVLADVSCILLAEGASLDADAKGRAEENGVAVLRSEKPAYELAKGLAALLAP
jgi:hypothetical protein